MILHGAGDGEDVAEALDRRQRRQITVMFCDMAGSTRLASRLDPEDMRDVANRFLQFCSAEIEAAGGYVARYMGDGLLAYFGHPEVREDDPIRAMRAALAIRTGAPDLRVAHVGRLAVRIGVATGVVVSGDVIGHGAAREEAVFGQAPNLAARLQSCAGRNQVVVTDLTRQLSGAAFEFEDLGARRLKGIPGATPRYRLVGPKARTLAKAFPTRLMGRRRELAWLSEHHSAAAGGEGRLVLLTGQAGIGKSRLLEHWRQDGPAAANLWLQAEAAEHLKRTPLQPAIGLVRRMLRVPEGAAGPDPVRQLQVRLARAGVVDEAAGNLLAGVMGWDAPASGLTSLAERTLLLSSLEQWLLSIARGRRTVLVLEDVHWADPSTLELLQRLAVSIASTSLLVVCTSREASLPGLRLGRGRTLRLGPLPDGEVEQLVRAVAGALVDRVDVAAAVARADGVPLFAEELAKRLATSGADQGAIPATLSDLLMSRLDALGPLKTIAQIAAVLGDGDCAVLAACTGQTLAQAERARSRLTEAGVFVRREDQVDGYVFRHALVREAAYEALLKTQRKAIHRRAAVVLSRAFPHVAAARPEVLAQHWTSAGNAGQALSAWRDAARLASERRAYREAERAYVAALQALSETAASSDLSELELDLWSGLVTARQIVRGYSAVETLEAVNAARRLAEQRGDISQQFAQGARDWMGLSSAGDYARAGPIAERLFALANAEGGEGIKASAYTMLLTSRFRLGDLAGAEEAFEQGLASFRSDAFRRQPGGSAQAFGNAAVNAWLRDDPAAARARTAESLAVSLASGNPYEAAFAQYMAGIQAVLMEDYAEAACLAERALVLSQAGVFPQFEATSRIVLGRATAGLGETHEGLSLINAGLEDMERRTRSRAGLTMYLTWRGEVRLLNGEPDAALDAHEIALAAHPEERFFRAEGLRQRGLTLAALGRKAEAHADLSASLDVAGDLGARLSARRAAADLAANA